MVGGEQGSCGDHGAGEKDATRKEKADTRPFFRGNIVVPQKSSNRKTIFVKALDRREFI